MNNNLNNLLCCQKKLINIFKEFDKVCVAHNISYFCFERTLTGIIKNNGWLDFGIDIDIAMNNNDYKIFKKYADSEMMTTLWLQDKTIDFRYKSDICVIRELYSIKTLNTNDCHNGLTFNIHLFTIEKNEIILNNKKINYEYIFPTNDVLFENISVSVPNKIIDFCTNYYGIYPPDLQCSKDLINDIDPYNASVTTLQLYKDLYDEKTKEWFSRIASRSKIDSPLHHGSGWLYLSQEKWDAFLDNCMKYIDLKNINSIFEGGCGVGAVFKYILSKNISIKISGIDICKEAINKCIENFPMSNVAVKDVCNLDSYDTNSFDSVISVCVLSYLDSLESIKKAVDELIRITRIGGKLAICTFTDTEKGMKSFRQIVPKKWWEQQNFNISFLSIEDIGLEDFPNRYSVFMVKN